MSDWPFPPLEGPTPWTAEQEAAYQRRKRQQEEEERDKMEEAPW